MYCPATKRYTARRSHHMASQKLAVTTWMQQQKKSICAEGLPASWRSPNRRSQHGRLVHMCCQGKQWGTVHNGM
jgi:hypothetical protein